MATFSVAVTTGRRFYADTRSNVWIQMFDWYGSQSEKIQLYNQNVHDFVYGRVDTFTITINDNFIADGFLPIQTIEITKDDTGYQPAWFLKDIVVTNVTTGNSSPFIFEQWFSGRNGFVHRRQTPLGDVYWCARDMTDSPLGNHQFLTIIFRSEEAARMACSPFGYSPETEEKNGTTFYFLTIGGFAKGCGFGEEMYCTFNQTDDVFSVREYFNPDDYTHWYSPDFDYQGHLINKGEQNVGAVIRAADNFNLHTSRPTFMVPLTTCATFVNSLLASLKYSETYRNRIGDFWGIDSGNESLIDLYYFSPPAA